jgi:hypothetical protein
LRTPTVTIGAEQYEIHTIKEYVNLPEFADGCRLAVALATLEDELNRKLSTTGRNVH